MFFSDDLLSSKKGSFGIIWLAATLGPKTKRITRKQLTGVDLTKTCELIAEPPEPLALRLSGCLLVGVARVYNQNYDLFYTDVTKFHSDLRRMVLTDFGGPTGPGGQPVGLDLVGDGKARIDQITFGGEDASWLSNLNSDFINMRWNHPGFVSRDRQASTQLSSLHSQGTQQTEEDLSSDDESEVDDIDIDDPERPRRKRKSSKNFPSSPGAKKIRPSVLPSSDPGDAPFDIGPQGLFGDDIFIDSYVPTSSPAGLIEPFDVPAPDVDVPVGDGQTTPRLPSEEVIHENGNPVPPHGSLASLEEVDGLVEPPKKKKKAKKAKKVKFDDDLEMEYDLLKEVSYAQRMSEERAEMKSRERSKNVDDRATALVDGGGDWINFFDPEMKEVFATCSRPGKFKWESDQQINGGPKYHEPKQGQNGEIDHTQDPFGPDVTGQDTTYVDPYQDFEITVPGEDPPEMARRPTQEAQAEAPLPWADEAFDDNSSDFGHDLGGFSPGSRLSNVTPLERKIRNSSGLHSLAGRNKRARSESVLGDRTTDHEQLVSDENANDYDVEAEGFDAGNLPASQMRQDLPDAFQPHMLATLEKQCRDFMAFTERKMFEEEKTELTFEEIVEDDSTKKVAALAFYNCLTLATKKILSVSQPTPWESITLKFSAEV